MEKETTPMGLAPIGVVNLSQKPVRFRHQDPEVFCIKTLGNGAVYPDFDTVDAVQRTQGGSQDPAGEADLARRGICKARLGNAASLWCKT